MFEFLTFIILTVNITSVKFGSIMKPDGVLHGAIVKAMDFGIVESEFLLQSRYYVHFLANTLRKGIKPVIPPALG